MKWAGGSFQVSDIHGICKDDAVRNFETFEALANYRNDLDGELCALDFSLKDSRGNRVSAEIKNDSHFHERYGSAYFYVVGDEATCIQLRSSIRRDMKSYRPWYWPLAWMTFGTFMNVCLVLSGLYPVLRVMGVIDFDTTIILIPSHHQINALMVVPLTILIMWTFLKLGGLLKKHLFPPVTFSIGHGKTRDKNREWVRRLIVGAVVSTIALSILTGLGNLY